MCVRACECVRTCVRVYVCVRAHACVRASVRVGGFGRAGVRARHCTYSLARARTHAGIRSLPSVCLSLLKPRCQITRRTPTCHLTSGTSNGDNMQSNHRPTVHLQPASNCGTSSISHCIQSHPSVAWRCARFHALLLQRAYE